MWKFGADISSTASLGVIFAISLIFVDILFVHREHLQYVSLLLLCFPKLCALYFNACELPVCQTCLSGSVFSITTVLYDYS